MASCNVCQMQGLEWSENVNSQGKHYLYSETGPHICKPASLKPNPIPIEEVLNGIIFDRKPESLGLAITNEAMRCGLNPFKIKLEKKGKFIIIH